MMIIVLTIASQVTWCDDQSKSIHNEGRLSSILHSIKQASFDGADLVRSAVVSIPFTKMVMTTGALLGLFLVFIRILIVIGPILLLGALTRESTDAKDLLRMLIEFYNQVIVALDDQMSQSNPE